MFLSVTSLRSIRQQRLGTLLVLILGIAVLQSATLLSLAFVIGRGTAQNQNEGEVSIVSLSVASQSITRYVSR